MKTIILLKYDGQNLYQKYKQGTFDRIVKHRIHDFEDENETLFYAGYCIANALKEGLIKYEDE